MAINVSFEGFVNEIKTFDWGTVAKVAHAQRAKNEQTGQWETVGKDYFDVTLPDGVTVRENERVNVIGTMKTGTYNKKDGSVGVALKVRATSIVPVEARGSAAGSFTAPSGWDAVDDEAF